MSVNKLRIVDCVKKIFIVSLVLLFASCVSLPQNELENRELADIFPQNAEWTQVCQGLSYFTFNSREEKLIYHAVKIELEGSKINLVYFPDKTTVFKDGVFHSVNTKTFAKEKNCLICINAAPFNGNLLSSKRVIAGTHIIDSIEYGTIVPSYAALCFTKTTLGYEAEITESQAFLEKMSFDYAFGGFFQILKDGNFISFKRYRNSRCGAGLSLDKKTLYILVCEGEVPLVSEGLTFEECALIFKALGASDALEFDGGSSAELCINGRSILSYKQKRVQASSFGFTK